MADKGATRLSSEFLRNRHNLDSFIHALVRDRGTAEDIFQEVWLRLASAVEKGHAIDDVAKWSRGVPKNLVLHHWREQRTSKVVHDTELLNLVGRSFDEQDSRQEYWSARRDAMRECLETLPPRSRRMLSLKYDSGLTFGQIALKIGKTAASIMMQVSRIRHSIGKCCEEKLRLQELPR